MSYRHVRGRSSAQTCLPYERTRIFSSVTTTWDFPFVYRIEGKVTSDRIISKMSEVFAENGSPSKVVSDNGGHYSSQAFRNFAAEWCFDHVTSSPHFPQSNGFIERQVQTVKYTLKKAAMSRSNPQKALLALRSTPIDSHLPSPAEMLNARKYKSNVPVIITNEHWSKDEIRRRLAERQEIQVSTMISELCNHVHR